MKPTENDKLSGVLWAIRFQKEDVTTFPDGIMAMNQRLVDKVVLELEKLGYKRDTP